MHRTSFSSCSSMSYVQMGKSKLHGWKPLNFKMSFERSLLCKSLNKQSFQYMMFSACLLGSCEDVSYECYMILTTATSSRAVSESEEESVSH